MKRLLIAGIMLGVVAAAQVRGIPASATSPHRGGLVLTPGGIPSSVASPGRQGYTFTPDFRPVGPPIRDRLNRAYLRTPVPLFYAVPVYEIAYVPVTPQSETSYRLVEPPATRGEPARVIVEIRDTRPQPAAEAKPVAVAATRPAPAPEPELPRMATVFIFHDGSRKELKDFAITASELIDLTNGLIKRSPLTSLDRAATLKANAENGVQVHLPAAASD